MGWYKDSSIQRTLAAFFCVKDFCEIALLCQNEIVEQDRTSVNEQGMSAKKCIERRESIWQNQ